MSWPVDVALVEGGGQRVVAGVDGRAVGLQGVSERGAAFVGQRLQACFDWHGCGAVNVAHVRTPARAAVADADEVVALANEDARDVVALGHATQRIVVSDDRVADVAGAIVLPSELSTRAEKSPFVPKRLEPMVREPSPRAPLTQPLRVPSPPFRLPAISRLRILPSLLQTTPVCSPSPPSRSPPIETKAMVLDALMAPLPFPAPPSTSPRTLIPATFPPSALITPDSRPAPPHQAAADVDDSHVAIGNNAAVAVTGPACH